MKNILVGIDFDEKTELLLEKAQDLARKYGAKLWLLHAVSPLPEFVGFDATPHYVTEDRPEILTANQHRLDDYANKLKADGIDSEGVLLEGTTISVILEESVKLNVDLIICGHHEHNFLYNLIFGSVSAAIVRQSDIPVLVYPLG